MSPILLRLAQVDSFGRDAQLNPPHGQPVKPLSPLLPNGGPLPVRRRAGKPYCRNAAQGRARPASPVHTAGTASTSRRGTGALRALGRIEEALN